MLRSATTPTAAYQRTDRTGGNLNRVGSWPVSPPGTRQLVDEVATTGLVLSSCTNRGRHGWAQTHRQPSTRTLGHEHSRRPHCSLHQRHVPPRGRTQSAAEHPPAVDEYQPSRTSLCVAPAPGARWLLAVQPPCLPCETCMQKPSCSATDVFQRTDGDTTE